MTDILTIKSELISKVHSVCEHLLPNGRMDKRDWVVGSVMGEAGNSLKVCTSGAKAGRWADFATGGELRGDMLDLWCAVRGCTLPQALDEARAFLGIKAPEFDRDTRQRVWRRPEKPKCIKPKSDVLEYLTTSRKISAGAIASYRVGEAGRTIVFHSFLPDGTLAFVKYLEIDRPDGKKVIRAEANCEPVLFGWQAIPDNEREISITEGECFPGDAEILTPEGWVRFDAYAGQMVAQYHPDGSSDFVEPIATIKKPYDGDLIRNEVRGWVSITTPEHNLVAFDTKGRLRKHPAHTPVSRTDTIPRVCKIDGPGIPLTNDQIALCLAVSADAAIRPIKNTGKNRVSHDRYAVFGFKRERKVARLRSLLMSLGLQSSDNPIARGYTSICLALPSWVPGRVLPDSWLALATADQREFILAEMIHWDGNSVPNRNQTEFSSKLYENARWMQTIAHTSGRVSTIIPRSNDYGSWFKVSILHGKRTSSWQAVEQTSVPHTGEVFCVQVPTGMILVRQEGKITVTGNCDALTLHDYGFPALSVPFGGGKGAKQAWIESEFERLGRFEVIYLVLDDDEEGHVAAEEIANRIGRHRCRLVKLPRKDANQCAMDGVPRADIEAAYAAAASLDPPELRRVGAFVDDVISLFWPDGTKPVGSRLPFGKIGDKLIFRPGEVTIWTGASGTGKSQVLSHATVGWVDQGDRICIASLEMKPAQLLRRMVKQAGNLDRPTPEFIRDIIEWMDRSVWLFDLVGKSPVKRLLEVFEYARARYGCNVFQVDSMMRLGVGSEDYEGQEKAVYQLVEWATASNVHLHLVAHARKADRQAGGGVPETEDIKGAAEIGFNAFNIVAIWRNLKLEDEIKQLEGSAPYDPDAASRLAELLQKPTVMLNIAKQRNGDHTGKCGLWFNPSTYQYRSSEDDRFGQQYVTLNREMAAE